MANGEDNRVGQVDFVGILVDGGRDDGRVDDDGVVGGHGLTARLHAGVLRGEVDPDVFVEDEGYPDLTYRATAEGKTFRHSSFLNSGALKPFHAMVLSTALASGCESPSQTDSQFFKISKDTSTFRIFFSDFYLQFNNCYFFTIGILPTNMLIIFFCMAIKPYLRYDKGIFFL